MLAVICKSPVNMSRTDLHNLTKVIATFAKVRLKSECGRFPPLYCLLAGLLALL